MINIRNEFKINNTQNPDPPRSVITNSSKTLIRILPTFDDMAYFMLNLFTDLGYMPEEEYFPVQCRTKLVIIFENDNSDEDYRPMDAFYLRMVDALYDVFYENGFPLTAIEANPRNSSDGYIDSVEKIAPG